MAAAFGRPDEPCRRLWAAMEKVAGVKRES